MAFLGLKTALIHPKKVKKRLQIRPKHKLSMYFWPWWAKMQKSKNSAKYGWFSLKNRHSRLKITICEKLPKTQKLFARFLFWWLLGPTYPKMSQIRQSLRFSRFFTNRDFQPRMLIFQWKSSVFRWIFTFLHFCPSWSKIY